MPEILILISRWLVWSLLVALESVVGFPWLSVYFAGEWLFKFSSRTWLASLLFMSLVFAAAFSLPLILPGLLLTVIWQTTGGNMGKTWWRWGAYLGSALIIGLAHQVPLNVLSVAFTLLSFLIFIKVPGGKFKRPWRTKPSLPLSDV
jgi:hypothetical protein